MQWAVSRWVTAHIPTCPVEVPVTVVLRYDPRDPFAVEFSFNFEGWWVPWQFARELLEAGMGARAGAGDVQIAPRETAHDSRIVVGLIGAEESGVVEFQRADLVGFLAATYELVPRGGEVQDVDAALDALLDRTS